MPPEQIIQIVQSSPAWWQAWLPVLGSALVATAAYTGVVKSNRTNRDGIAAADAREHTKWQREALMEASAAVMEKSRIVRGIAARVAEGGDEPYYHEGPTRPSGPTFFGRYNQAIDDLSQEMQRLRMVADVNVYTTVQSVLDAHKAARGAAFNWVKSLELGDLASDDPTATQRNREIREALWASENAVLVREHELADAVCASLGIEPLLSPGRTPPE
ncbi:hypothetical protein [Nocardia sp. MW-W600-9]